MELLERDSPLRDLGESLQEATAGRGRIALVSGEAGIGKTALVEVFLAGHRTEVRLLRGQCDALFTPQPRAPLYDIAHQTNGGLLELVHRRTIDRWQSSAPLRELQGEGKADGARLRGCSLGGCRDA
jgi:predicted ATPase